MRAAGVSLEESFLKISVAEKHLGAIKPVESEDLSLPVPETERVLLIKDAFKRLKDEYKVDSISIGLAFSDFSCHIIDMPALSVPDMKNALLYELEKYLPLPPDEYIYDFSIIEKVNKKAKILILSVLKNRMDGILDAATDAGIRLNAIRCSFIEGVNAFIAASRITDAVFIYAEEGVYHVVVLKDQMPVQFRTILKGKAALDELEGFLSPFTCAKYISGIYDSGIAERIDANTCSISIADAVAQSALRKRRFELNFVPAEFLPEKKDYYPYMIGTLAALSVLMFFFTAIYSYYKDYSALAAVEKKIGQVKAKTTGSLETKKKIEFVGEKKKFLSDFRAKKNINIKVLSELSKILPKDVWLTGVSVDEKGKVEIEGFARRAANIVEPLNKSKLFRRIEFASPIVLQGTEERFSIRMEIAG